MKKLTGLSIPLNEMKNLLEGLGVVIIKETNHFFEVTIPSHRVDLQQDADLVEEIIRLYGYDKLQAQPMQTSVQAGLISAKEKIATHVSSWFSAKGYHETISYSFVDPELQEALYPQKNLWNCLIQFPLNYRKCVRECGQA